MVHPSLVFTTHHLPPYGRTHPSVCASGRPRIVLRLRPLGQLGQGHHRVELTRQGLRDGEGSLTLMGRMDVGLGRGMVVAQELL